MKTGTVILVLISLIVPSSCLIFTNPIRRREISCTRSAVKRPRWLFEKLVPPCYSSPEVANAVFGPITDGAVPKVTVTCDDGFVFPDRSSIRVMTFVAGKWEEEEDCEAKECYVEAQVNTMLKDGLLPDLSDGLSLTVVCEDGYLTSTGQRTYQSTCQVGGTWHHADNCTFNATTACPAVPVFNTVLSEIPLSVDGTTFTVVCEEGKELPGESTISYDTTCSNGEWSDTRSCGLRSCLEGLEMSLSSGVYKLYPDEALTEIEVYCDFADGNAFTVIQQRVNDSLDFERNWNEYVAGFGDPLGNFWLGLENIHILTNSARYKLDVEVTDEENNLAFACYHDWKIRDADSKFALVSTHDFVTGNPNAGNGLFSIDNVPFSTPDMDNDPKTTGANAHCAQYYKSGWWFKSCGNSNLNGPYFARPGINHSGIRWDGAGGRIGRTESATQCRMMLNVGPC